MCCVAVVFEVFHMQITEPEVYADFICYSYHVPARVGPQEPLLLDFTERLLKNDAFLWVSRQVFWNTISANIVSHSWLDVLGSTVVQEL